MTFFVKNYIISFGKDAFIIIFFNKQYVVLKIIFFLFISVLFYLSIILVADGFRYWWTVFCFFILITAYFNGKIDKIQFIKNIKLSDCYKKTDNYFYFRNYRISCFDEIIIYEKKTDEIIEIVLIGKILFISDIFIKLLSKKDLEVIILHEEFHLKNYHSLKSNFLYFTFLFLFVFAISKITINLFFIILLLLMSNVIIKIIVNFYLRYCEYSSDLYAAIVLNNFKDTVSALETYLKLEDSFQKDKSGFKELFMSHPSLKKRIEKLKKEQLC